ncbi:PHP domain-containing protein [Lentibacillus amyloliquefaciens]|uniref:Phosphoesterase n=1 Tax=Lentibacillus amyloliquefaciens TaxID=1472767 RepID=A0A0U4DXC3_9BACI|nr:PHP domain-containing protein [Lentibacillus amyloliquefaciens]ALX50024.1 phosphoesterase [Lentibacillus amyloliquefaciens]
MKADLHVHSHYSDGSGTVDEVLRAASENGVNRISFVDHDTTQGLFEKIETGKQYGIDVVPGIEISAYDYERKRKVHVLGYHFSPDAIHIHELCQPLLRKRHAFSLWQIDQIRSAGYPLDPEGIGKSASPGGTIYKQHIMKHLTTSDYHAAAYQTLYQQLFKGNGPASGDIAYIDAFDAVRAIRADDGIAVVAHPGQLDSYDIIHELIPIGLNGVERNHPDHTEEDHQKVEALASEYNLYMTGGTDYHGTFGVPIQVGDLVSPSSLESVDIGSI